MITLLLPSTFEKIMVCNNNNFIFNKHNYYYYDYYYYDYFVIIMLLNRQRDCLQIIFYYTLNHDFLTSW